MTFADDLYPEHAKLVAAREKSQTITDFVEFGLMDQDIHLCRYDRATGSYHPISRSIETILETYFGIDRDALDKEKNQIMKVLRSTMQEYSHLHDNGKEADNAG